MQCLKVCYNHLVLNITRRLLVLTNHRATVLFLSTDFFKTPRNYTEKLGSVTTKKKSKDVLEAAIVSTPELFISKINRSPMTLTPVKETSDRK